MENGEVRAISTVGEFSIKQLRLNRTPLIALRLKRLSDSEDMKLLTRYKELIELQEKLNRQLASLTIEQNHLLEEQQLLLKLILEFYK